MSKTFSLLVLLAATLFQGVASPVFAAADAVDAQLISNCAARTDARMESMTLGKLEQIRNFEFSLRMAMAQTAGGAEAMSPVEWQRATTQLRHARSQLAQVCGVAVPVQG